MKIQNMQFITSAINSDSQLSRQEAFFGKLHACENGVWLNVNHTSAFSHLGNEFAAKSSDSPFVQWTGTICESLVECITRNNSVKLF